MKMKHSMGWRRDLPDARDFDVRSDDIAAFFESSSGLKGKPRRKSTKKSTAEALRVDLSEFCSPIEDQENIGSCTAHAAVGLMEYFEQRGYGTHVNASRLFLYKVTRNLMRETGDTGAYLRDTMKALAAFGAPPERHWPYDTAAYDTEPTAFCYAFAQGYTSLKYYRLDPANATGKATLESVKQHLVSGYPSMFGFTVYNDGNKRGEFAYPSPRDPVLGGHAVIAIGFDDEREIGRTKGALKIRNSWGEGWGEKGYGWLPYAYVENRLAVDFWSIVDMRFLDTEQFEQL